MPTNEIRPAKPDDLTVVRALLAEHELVYTDLGPAHMASFVVVPAHDQPASVAAVAGVETFPDDAGEGLLRSVAVRASLRGRGIGVNLVAAVEERARLVGIRRLWLLTTTAPDFFRRLGYADTPRAIAPVAVQQSSEFKSLCPASAICLSKRL